MTQLLERAFTEASKISEVQQNTLASWLLDELLVEKKWDSLFMQALLNYLANEEGVSLQAPQTNQGQKMAAILQRMADRNALSQMTDPVAWQREIRNSLLTGKKC